MSRLSASAKLPTSSHIKFPKGKLRKTWQVKTTWKIIFWSARDHFQTGSLKGHSIEAQSTPHKILTSNFDHSIKVFFIVFAAEINLQRTFFFKKCNISLEFIELPE